MIGAASRLQRAVGNVGFFEDPRFTDDLSSYKPPFTVYRDFPLRCLISGGHSTIRNV